MASTGSGKDMMLQKMWLAMGGKMESTIRGKHVNVGERPRGLKEAGGRRLTGLDEQVSGEPAEQSRIAQLKA